MNKKIALFLFLIFICIMLCFPEKTFSGAQDGLLLWFQVILPALLPFMILSNLLINTNGINVLAKIIGPFFSKLFGVSQSGSYAVLSGFLCGYPVGAKVTADLLHADYISREEAAYLLSFCNNASPAFISSYIVHTTLQEPRLLFPVMFLLFLSPVLCSFLFRSRQCVSKRNSKDPDTHKAFTFSFEQLDLAIMNSFETITKIGGYIILFSILFSLLKELPYSYWLSVVEITNGIPYVFNSDLPFDISFIIIMASTSFGGLCSIAQTYSVTHSHNISIFAYIKQKLITALVTSFLALIYILIIHR